MVTGQRGTSRAGIVVVGLLALGAVEACGSRSPLVGDFGEGFAGLPESGGTGGSLGGTLGGGRGGTGGAVGGIGGDYPGMGASPGQGGAYPGGGGTYPGSGGAYPMGVGGTTPVAGYGGTGMSVGGAYPSAGYGGVGVGGALPMGGFGGKGMGNGGKGGGGKGGGDPRVYKGCLLTCSKYQDQCPELAGSCSADCEQLRGLYPECSGPLGDYFFCLNENMAYGATCTQDTCSGPDCFAEAQESCAWAVESFLECLAPDPDPQCSASGEFFDQGCSIQTYCDPDSYFTKCTQIDYAEPIFECTCTTSDTAASTVLSGYDGYEACYEMERQCGFPQVLAPL